MGLRIKFLWCLLLLSICKPIHSQQDYSVPEKIMIDSLSRLIETGDVVLDQELTDSFRENQLFSSSLVYINPTTGQAYLQMAVLAADILAFSSYSEMEQLLTRNIVVRRHRRQHTFHDYIRDTTLYFRYTDHDAQILETQLGINSSELNRSVRSVLLIQDALNTFPKTQDYLGEDKSLFYAIANYIGDIIYNQHGGWLYKTHRNGRTILPESIPLEGRSSYNWFREIGNIFLNKDFNQLEELIYIAIQH